MGLFSLVPEEGLEPSIRKERDFESRAYTNSATPALTTVKAANRETCHLGCTDELYYN